jgi:hypothetical protein
LPQGDAAGYRRADRRRAHLRGPRYQARHGADARPRQEGHHHKDDTTIVDGAGKKRRDIEARIGQIKQQIEDTN